MDSLQRKPKASDHKILKDARVLRARPQIMDAPIIYEYSTKIGFASNSMMAVLFLNS